MIQGGILIWGAVYLAPCAYLDTRWIFLVWSLLGSRIGLVPMDLPLVISFDLDETLLCEGNVALADPEVPTLEGPFGCRVDRMRLGAVPLLRGLAAEGCQIWVYTQSLRGRSDVMEWFASFGVSLAGYVNLPLHESACDQRGIVGKKPRKCPHWFGIDVHVDDDINVADECRDSGCRVIIIDPSDVDFETSVRAHW